MGQSHILYLNPKLDQATRQISFTTASTNDPPMARGQFIKIIQIQNIDLILNIKINE